MGSVFQELPEQTPMESLFHLSVVRIAFFSQKMTPTESSSMAWQPIFTFIFTWFGKVYLNLESNFSFLTSILSLLASHDLHVFLIYSMSSTHASWHASWFSWQLRRSVFQELYKVESIVFLWPKNDSNGIIFHDMAVNLQLSTSQVKSVSEPQVELLFSNFHTPFSLLHTRASCFPDGVIPGGELTQKLESMRLEVLISTQEKDAHTRVVFLHSPLHLHSIFCPSTQDQKVTP